MAPNKKSPGTSYRKRKRSITTTPSSIYRIARTIENGKKFLITTHRNPDGDAIGSSLGMYNIIKREGKKAVLWIPEGIPYCYRFLKGSNSAVKTLSPSAKFDATVVLDVASPQLLALPLPEPRKAGKIIVIDHHEIHTGWGDIYLNEKVAAVGLTLHKLVKTLRLELHKEIAECIYVSILTDTGCFRYPTTTSQLLRLAARCLEAGVDPWKVSMHIYENYPAERMYLLAEVLSTLKVELGGKFASITSSNTMLKKYGLQADALEDFINFPRGIEGVEVASLIRRRSDGTIRVSLRSAGNIDVAKIARNFGGGGHRNASGCTFGKNRSIKSVKEELKNYLKQHYKFKD